MGRNIEKTIVIRADVQATLSGMNEVVNKLNQGLREGATKVDLTKGVGLSLSKQIDKYKQELGKFQELTKGNKVEFADAGDAIKSGESLIKTFRELKRITGDFNDLSVLDAKRIFPDAFDSRVLDLQSSLNKLSSSLSKLETKKIDLNNTTTEIEGLREEARKFKDLMDQETTVKVELDEAKAVLEQVNDEIDRIRTKASEGITLKIKTVNEEKNEAVRSKQQIWNRLKKQGLNEADFAGSNTNATKFKGKSASAWEKQASKKDGSETSKAEAKAALALISVYNKEKGVLLELSEIIEQRTAEAKQLTTSLAKVGKISLPEAVQISGGSAEEINEATIALQWKEEALKDTANAQAKYNVATTQAKGAESNYAKTTAAIEAQEAKVQKLTAEIAELDKEVSTTSLEKAFSSVGITDFNIEMLKSKDGIEQLKSQLAKLDEAKLTSLKQELKDMGLNTEMVEEALKEVRTVVDQVDEGAKDIKKTASEIENLRNQVLQFFSLTNAVQLFKRAVSSALNTVKELDATMTEAAVVTEFDVGDMWNKLPQYSAEAQKLGVSINGMYQATTLYYQQGLKTNEAMQIGVETMKMAKIASMDSTEATKAMTAALRGFNMELNETSATRVNDVYSQLAAVTAADTNQIATAMEKTASIAASANMEFETTAALLAQIIETTQEAPETAGTAMKTIIARFAEVKELKASGQSTGKDSEGEDIDVNKIQTALRSVGISMDGFFEGTEGLDSVLLKLSAKWGDLDFETQRYIATMAAGSRQQSRFIAMMSDYGRTTELVNEAQNSAGASQSQFEKTQESLASSLTKLKNAWDQFLMGLANNEILKGAVDTLTFVLETINKLIDGISGGNGLVKSITSLMSVIGALKLGKKVFEGDKFGGFIGKITGKGQGTTEVIDRKTTDANGNIIEEHIVRNPQQQGEQAGQQAGIGFVSGFKNAVKANAQGETGFGNFMKNMFTTGIGEEVNGKNRRPTQGAVGKLYEKRNQKIQKKYEENYGEKDNQTRKDKYLQSGKTKLQQGKGFLDELKSNNQDLGAEGLKQVQQAYIDVYKETKNVEQAMDAASQKTQELGGTLLDSSTKAKMMQEQSSGLTLNLQSMGQAAIGVGAAIGGLGALFSALGLEEAAEATSKVAAVFMGFGSVLSTLSAIAPMLGMSFTTAGIQITTAGVTSQLAWWWVFVIIAAVAALVALFISINKTVQAGKLENKMKAAAEATKQAAKEAEKAKENYDNLLSGKNKYTELQETLTNLTKGTQEWKEALVEANSQVLSLLTDYPELAAYIATGEDGQLTITTEGWDELIKAQQKTLANAQLAVGSARIKEAKLKREKNDANFRARINQGSLSNDDQTVVKRAEMLQKAYLEYGNDLFKKEGDNFSEELEELANAMGELPETLWEMKDALGDWHQAVVESEGEILAQSKATLMASASQETLDYEYGDDLIQAFGTSMSSSGYTAQEEEMTESMKGKQKMTNNTNVERIAKEYGVYEDLSGKRGKKKRTEDLRIVYAAMKGLDADDEDIQKMDQDQLAKAIAALDTANNHKQDLESFRKKMQDMGGKSQQQLATILSGDTSNLTLNEMNSILSDGSVTNNLHLLSAEMGYKDTEDMAKELGYGKTTLSELSYDDQKKYFELVSEEEQAKWTDENGEIDYTGFIAEWADAEVSAEYQLIIDSQQNEEKIKEGYNDAQEKISSFSTKSKEEIDTIFGNSSVAVLDGISSQISNMATEDADKYIDVWQTTLGSSDIGNQQKEQLESYLSQVDWSNMTEAIDAMDYMQQMGMDTSVIENFWNTATDGAGAYVRNVAEALALAERMQNKVQNTNKIIERLTSGKGTYEDVMELSKQGIDISKMQLTPEGWKMSAEDAAKATEQSKTYQAEQAQNVRDRHREEYAQAQQIQKNLENGATGIFEALRSTTTIQEDGSLVAGTINNLWSAGDIAQTLGLERYDKNSGETEEEYIARIQAEYNQFVDLINNGEQIDIINTKTAEMAEAAKYSTEEAIANGHSDDSVRYSMMNEAASMGLDSGEVIAYSDSLKELGIESQALRDQIALDHAIMNQGAKELNENWDTWQQNLSVEGTKDYNDALTALGKSAKKLVGVETDLSKEFLKNSKNQELVKKAAEGNKEALEELRKAAAKDIFGQLKAKGEQAFERVQQDIEDVAESDIDIGVTVTMEEEGEGSTIAEKLTNIYNEAYNAAIAGGKSLAEAQAIANDAINAEGFTVPELVEKTTTVTGDLPNGYTVQEDGSTVVDANGVPVKGYKVIGQDSGQYTYTVTRLVPKEQEGYTKVNDNVGGASNGGNKGGGGGGNKYKNSKDKYHNTLEEINDLLRERERLERRYQRLTTQGLATAKELAKISRASITTQEQEIARQQIIKQGRIDQINEEISKNPEMQKFVQVETGLDGQQSIRIDWEEFEALRDSEKGEKVDEYYDKIQEWLQSMYDAEVAIEEAQDAIYEEMTKGKDEYLNLEEQVKEAIIADRQKEIDKLSDINDSINDTNSKILESMQQQIDEYRQDRDNKKTEEELGDKQRKLAYLQQDTSGANALEILQLQKEIDEGQESYTDQLIDQKISDLQEQNDQAAEQRQQQIDILQAQLDHYIESGQIWNEVQRLMGEGVDLEKGLIQTSELAQLLKDAAGFEGMSKISQMEWLKELNTTIAGGFSWLQSGALLTMFGKDKQVSFTNEDNQQVTGTIDENGNIVTSNNEIYKGDKVRVDTSGNIISGETQQQAQQNWRATQIPPEPVVKGSGNLASLPASQSLSKEQVKSLQKGLNELLAHGELAGFNELDVDGIYGNYTKGAVKKLQAKIGAYQDGKWGPKTRESFHNSSLKAYKTGGLADFTGPAWLDGTKSKPEYILNADQTKAFFQLVDVLSSLQTKPTQTTQNNGDNTFDIDINVESISSDYDVEQLADVIKRLINDDARYRNNNAINLMR